MTDPSEYIKKQISDGIELPQENKKYFNTFTIGISPADSILVLSQNGKQMISLYASHSVIKSLTLELIKMIKNFETQTGQEILTLSELEEKINNHNE